MHKSIAIYIFILYDRKKGARVPLGARAPQGKERKAEKPTKGARAPLGARAPQAKERTASEPEILSNGLKTYQRRGAIALQTRKQPKKQSPDLQGEQSVTGH